MITRGYKKKCCSASQLIYKWFNKVDVQRIIYKHPIQILPKYKKKGHSYSNLH